MVGKSCLKDFCRRTDIQAIANGLEAMADWVATVGDPKDDEKEFSSGGHSRHCYTKSIVAQSIFFIDRYGYEKRIEGSAAPTTKDRVLTSLYDTRPDMEKLY